MDDFVHMIRQAAEQAAGDFRPHVFGHIASYDPLLHRVRCMVPSMSEEDGSVLLSPWIPIGVPFGGQGFGFQYVYKGGASPANPTDGEQVIISVFDKARGVAAVPCMFYHPASPPPATNLPQQKDGEYPATAAPVAAGDLLISGTPTAQGNPNCLIRLRANGDIEMWGSGNLIANIIGGATVTTVNGDINATASQGNVNVVSTTQAVNVTADSEVVITAPEIVANGNFHCSGAVIAGFGTGDQITLQQHRHGTGGSTASSTVPPTPGT